MKFSILLLIILPLVLFGQHPVSKYFNSKSLLTQAQKLNNQSGTARDFTVNPDSISLEVYSINPYNTANQRLYYNEEDLISKVIYYIEKADVIIEKYRLEYNYNNDKELTSIRLFDIRTSNEKYIGRYEYTNQHDKVVCEKSFYDDPYFFQGDSLYIEYNGDKITNYKRLTSGLTIDDWYEDYEIDSIVYDNDKVVGYDRKIYRQDPDSIFTTYYRYRNALFYNDDDDIFRQILPVYGYDTSSIVSSFPSENEAENLIWQFNYDRYRFSQIEGDFVLNEIRHSEIKEDSMYVSLENFDIPFQSDINTTFDEEGRLVTYFIENTNTGKQLVNYDYSPTGRIGKVETNNFDDFHRIYIYEYEFDNNNNITVFRELLDEDADGINSAYQETRYFYSGSLQMNNSSSSTLKIYPNPVGNYICIPNLTDVRDFDLNVFDSNGKLIKIFQKTENNYLIEDLKPGIYIVKASCDNNIFYSKLIKL